MSGCIEVMARVSGRRHWSVEQKLAILREAFGPGGSVRSAMERHDITSGSLYTWRRNAMAGMLLDRSMRMLRPPIEEPTGGGFAEVIIADPVVPGILAALPAPAPDIASKIAIERPGGIRLSVDVRSMPMRSRACCRCSSDDRATPCNAGVAGVRADRYARGHVRAGGDGAGSQKHNPHSGAVFAFRGRRGDLIKLL
jgi:transposase